MLSTVGVLVSVGVVSVAAHFLLHVGWTNALLVGAVLSSTDAAAVFSVLRRVPLPRRVTGMLEAESGFNDAPVVLLVVTLAEQSAARRESHPWWALVLIAVLELAGGPRSAWPSATAAARVLRLVASASSGAVLHRRRRADRPRVRRRLPRAHQRVHRDVPGGAGAGQHAAAAPPGRPVLRPGPGLAGPDRAVRAAGAARQPDQPHVRRRPALGVGLVLLLLARPAR